MDAYIQTPSLVYAKKVVQAGTDFLLILKSLTCLLYHQFPEGHLNFPVPFCYFCFLATCSETGMISSRYNGKVLSLFLLCPEMPGGQRRLQSLCFYLWNYWPHSTV